MRMGAVTLPQPCLIKNILNTYHATNKAHPLPTRQKNTYLMFISFLAPSIMYSRTIFLKSIDSACCPSP